MLPIFNDVSSKLREKGVLLGETCNITAFSFCLEIGFSSVTINNGYNVRYHRDSNDNPITYAACAVMYEKSARPCPVSRKEGLVVIPEYQIALQLSHGDCYFLKVGKEFSIIID